MSEKQPFSWSNSPRWLRWAAVLSGPLLEQYQVFLRDGMLDAAGEVQLGAEQDAIHLEELDLYDIVLDYVYLENHEEEEEGLEAGEAAAAVIEGADPRETDLSIGRMTVRGSFGFKNRAEKPAYRVFLNEAVVELTNYSNQFLAGPAEAHLEGMFMGSGPTFCYAMFRPEEAGPDFDLQLEITETYMPTMNDLLQAYGDFEVRDGQFSFFSELLLR